MISSSAESTLTKSVVVLSASPNETTPSSQITVESIRAISSDAQSESTQRLISSTTAEPSSGIATDTSLQPSPTSTGGNDNLLCMCICVCVRVWWWVYSCVGVGGEFVCLCVRMCVWGGGVEGFICCVLGVYLCVYV